MCDFKPNFRRAIIRSNVHTRLKSDSNTLPIDIKRGPREKVIRQKWIIAEENIPHLPFMHHLRSNHVEVTKFRPSIIARNIQQCLRKLSITALFDNNKAIAHAVTNQNLKFDIRLYGSQTKLNNQSESKTIVEIQRMTSFKFGFDKIVKAIFLAANGKAYVVPDMKQSSNWYNLSRTESRRSTSELDEEKIGLEELNRIGNMLSQKQLDSNRLGMESLISLTNIKHTSEDILNLVANSLLNGNHHDFGGLRSKIYNLIVHGKMSKNQMDGKNEKNLFLETHYSEMRSDALQVYLNVLEIATATSSRLNIHEIISTIWFQDEFIHALFNIVRRSTTVPHSAHDAYIIMKCLNLIRCNSLLGCKLKCMISPLIQSTFESSALQEYHDLLAKESKDFMLSLPCV